MRKIMLIAVIAAVMTAMSLTSCNEPNPSPIPPETVETPPPPSETTPPTVSITNNNQTKTLAADLVIELSATVTQGTNPIQSKEWTLKSATVNGVTPVFADKTAATTTVTGIKKAGTFVFELKVKDTTGVEGIAEVTVVVEPMTVTANIVVPAIPFASTDILDFGLSSSYTGYNNDFPNGCITYTLKDNKDHVFSTQVNAGDSTLGYVNAEGITFTQTFYYNNQVVGTRIVLVRFATAGGGRFMTIDVDGSWASSGTIPPVTLTLSKTITEILPPPITKTVTVSFPAFVAGPTLSFAPTYTPAIAGGGFADSDVIYIVTDDQNHTWDSTTGYEVSHTLYSKPSDVVFTQTFKIGNTVLASQVVKATAAPSGGGRFSFIWDSDNNQLSKIPDITLNLSKPGTW